MLKQKIQQNLNQAVKKKEELKSSVLRLLLAAVLNKEKEKRFKLGKEKDVQLDNEEIIEIIFSEIKKRKEAILGFEKGQRLDLAKKEKKEMEILQEYLRDKGF